MSKIIKNTLLYTLSNILPQAVAFILLPLYTKYLLPEEYGIVNAMVVVQGILAIFFSLSIERSIIRMYWDYPEKEKLFLGTLTISITTLSVIVLVVSMVLKDFLQILFKDIEFYPFYVFTIILSFSLTFSLVPKNYFRLKNKAKEFFIISLVELVLNTILIIFFLVYLKESALGIIKAKMIVSLLMLPFYIGIIVKKIEFKFDFEILKNCLKFSLPIIPTLFAAWILGQADRVFIADYFTMHDVGIYSLSRRIAGIVGIIAGSFTMAYHPLFFELVNRNTNNNEKLLKINNAFIIIIILLGFIFAFLSKDLIYLFLNEKYYEAYIYIPPIIFTGVIGSISSTILGAFFQQSKKMKEDMIFGIIGAGLTLFFYFLLINKIGLWGAILGNLLATFVIFILLYNYAKKKCFFLPFEWGKISSLFIFTITIVVLFDNVFDLNILFSVLIKLIIITLLIIYIYKQYQNEITLAFKRSKF